MLQEICTAKSKTWVTDITYLLSFVFAQAPDRIPHLSRSDHNHCDNDTKGCRTLDSAFVDFYLPSSTTDRKWARGFSTLCRRCTYSVVGLETPADSDQLFVENILS